MSVISRNGLADTFSFMTPARKDAADTTLRQKQAGSSSLLANGLTKKAGMYSQAWDDLDRDEVNDVFGSSASYIMPSRSDKDSVGLSLYQSQQTSQGSSSNYYPSSGSSLGGGGLGSLSMHSNGSSSSLTGRSNQFGSSRLSTHSSSYLPSLAHYGQLGSGTSSSSSSRSSLLSPHSNVLTQQVPSGSSHLGGLQSSMTLQHLQQQSKSSRSTTSLSSSNSTGLSLAPGGQQIRLARLGGSQSFGASLGALQAFGSDSHSLDLTEFPALGRGGVRRGSASGSSAIGPSAPPRTGYGIVSKPREQEFTIHSEDFPALPGSNFKTSQSDVSSSQSDTSKLAPAMYLPLSIGSDSGRITGSVPVDSGKDIIGSSRASSVGVIGQRPVKSSTVHETAASATTRRGVQTSPNGTITNIPINMVTDQFGLIGLLTFIRVAETDPNLVALALGSDLTMLGLNLTSQDNLYSSFTSPFAEGPSRPQDIDYNVPGEYHINLYIREKLAPIKLHRYGEDLLFYLYYHSNGDVLQLASAAELYARDWRYHKEQHVWLTRAPGMEPTMKTNTFERGSYYVFDVVSWRKLLREMHIDYSKLEERPHLPLQSQQQHQAHQQQLPHILSSQ